MTLRKITIDYSVKYIPSMNSSPSENSRDHKPTTNSNAKKQNKKLSQNDKNFVKIITAEGFKILK